MTATHINQMFVVRESAHQQANTVIYRCFSAERGLLCPRIAFWVENGVGYVDVEGASERLIVLDDRVVISIR